MSDNYSNTQRGSIILFAAFLPILAVTTFVALQGLPAVAVFTAILGLLIVLSFGWLTVSVDDEAVNIKFGVGLGRRTVPLSAIRSAKVTKGSALSGIGIRWLGDGWLYNVAFGPVVEMSLADGKRVMVGTPEPQELLAAINSRLGERDPHVANAVRDSSTNWVPGALISGVVVVFVAGLLYLGSTAPVFDVTDGALRVKSNLYSTDVRIADITSAELVDQMPAMDYRNNGFAFNGHLRGRFKSNALGGTGYLFVEKGHPPYLLVKTATSFVLLNSEDPSETRRIAEQLRKS